MNLLQNCIVYFQNGGPIKPKGGPSSGPILGFSRINVFNHMEKMQSEFIFKLEKTRLDFTELREILVSYEIWASSSLELSSPVVITKLYILPYFLSFKELLDRVDFSLKQLEIANELFQKCHVDLYRAEDFCLNYELNVRIFFIANKWINQDLSAVNEVLSPLFILRDLKPLINQTELIPEKKVSSLNMNTLLPLYKIASITKETSLKVAGSNVPGEKQRPFKFNPSSLVFDLRRNSN